MSKNKKPEWQPLKDLRFYTTEYVVDASYEETFLLWEKYSELYGVKFEQDWSGYWEQIGQVDSRPICVSVFWWILEDTFRVAFVDGTSELVDWEMIGRWEKSVFRCLKEHGLYTRHSNAANFSNVLADIGRRLNKNIIRRDFDAIREAVRALPLRERSYR